MSVGWDGMGWDGMGWDAPFFLYLIFFCGFLFQTNKVFFFKQIKFSFSNK